MKPQWLVCHVPFQGGSLFNNKLSERDDMNEWSYHNHVSKCFCVTNQRHAKMKKVDSYQSLSLKDYLDSAPPGKSGTILSATMIGLDQIDIPAYLLLYDLKPLGGVQ